MQILWPDIRKKLRKQRMCYECFSLPYGWAENYSKCKKSFENQSKYGILMYIIVQEIESKHNNML